MSDQKLKLTPKEFEETYTAWMHNSMKAESEVMSKYSEQELDLLHRFIGYTYQIITVLGILAGFGFTAIQRVASFPLFIAGESLLVVAILYGLYWIKKFYESNISTIQASSNGTFKIYKDRDDIFLKINDEYIKTQTVDKTLFEEVMSKERSLVEYIGNRASSDKEKAEKMPHNIILLIATFGFVLLLASFVLSFNQQNKRGLYQRGPLFFGKESSLDSKRWDN